MNMCFEEFLFTFNFFAFLAEMRTTLGCRVADLYKSIHKIFFFILIKYLVFKIGLVLTQESKKQP